MMARLAVIASIRETQSDCVVVLFTGADAQRGFDMGDEDLAIADAPGLGCGGNGFHHPLSDFVRHDDFEFYLGQEIDNIFGTAIEFGVAFLSAEAFGLGHGDAGYAHFVERFLNFIELERLDNSFDLFHVTSERISGAIVRCGFAGPKYIPELVSK